MAAPNTLLIEGTFEELADELAAFVDQLNTAQNQQTQIQQEVAPLLAEGKKEDALKKLVGASAVINSAPEREFLAAYNLVIHLVHQAPNPDIFLPKICQNLSAPIPSSAFNSTGLALSALSTIFNTLPATAESRYHVLLAILKVFRSNATTFDQLRPQLKNLSAWLQAWEIDAEDARKLYLAISEVASDSGEDEASYQYLLLALRTLQGSADNANDEAKTLSLRALKSALLSPSHFDFQDLTSLDSIQALRTASPKHFELLEIFNADTIDDFRDFEEANPDFLAADGLDADILERKIRLLTMASIAANAHQSRTVSYATIAKALQIPREEVEMWAIDSIRSGLVEGKLSQKEDKFLVHRATYRVFGENQWREVASRLDMWKGSLQGVLAVIREQKEQYIRDREQELRDAEQRESGKGYRPNKSFRNAVEVGLD